MSAKTRRVGNHHPGGTVLQADLSENAAAEQAEKAMRPLLEFIDRESKGSVSRRLELLLALCQASESRLHFESGWIGGRVQWLVGSQAFLFSGFGVVSRDAQTLPAIAFLWVTPLVGITQACLIFVSIQAAKRVGHRLSATREQIDGAIHNTKGLETWALLGVTRFGSIKDTFSLGGLASAVLPITMIVAWGILLVVLIIASVLGTNVPFVPIIAGSGLH